jgi:hypothetical protein
MAILHPKEILSRPNRGSACPRLSAPPHGGRCAPPAMPRPCWISARRAGRVRKHSARLRGHMTSVAAPFRAYLRSFRMPAWRCRSRSPARYHPSPCPSLRDRYHRPGRPDPAYGPSGPAVLRGMRIKAHGRGAWCMKSSRWGWECSFPPSRGRRQTAPGPLTPACPCACGR